MTVIFKWDGETADRTELEELGFLDSLNDPRDFRTEQSEFRFNFVGFVANSRGDLLVVLPKHFEIKDPHTDIASLFRLVTQFTYGSTNRYFGSNQKPEYAADYPFSAFYAIYSHYRRWGLNTRIDKKFRWSPPGKLNWRKTIQKGSWIPTKNGLVPFPIIYETGQRLTTFLSECTVFAIDHTLERFSYFLDLEPTGAVRPEYDLGLHREYILETLRSLRKQTFRDSTLVLIDSLIAFYNSDHTGGSFYFKQYSFQLIWQEMVLTYLNKKFAGFGTNGEMIFSGTKSENFQFLKGKFQLNASKIDQHLEPDYYAISEDGKTQYIFDAKYYSSLKALDYKQLSYTLLLDSKVDRDGKRSFDRTFSVLLLPAAAPRSKVHFSMYPGQSALDPDLKITEEYLDIREITMDYLDP